MLTSISYFLLAITFLGTVVANEFNTLTQVQTGTDETLISSPLTGVASKSVQISFQTSYASNPTVLVYITYLSVSKSTAQDYQVGVSDISTSQFTLKYKSTTAGNTISMKVAWMAFETSSDAEVIYFEETNEVLSENTSGSTIRTYVREQEFSNSYSNPPSISMFLLGIKALSTFADTVSFSSADSTNSATTISVSTWYSCYVERVAYAILVVNSDICNESLGKQVNIKSGTVIANSSWMDKTQQNRTIYSTQNSTMNLLNSTATSVVRTVVSGLRGYDIRANTLLNLEILSSSYANGNFTQTVKTWGDSTVVQGFWDSIQVNTTPESYEELSSSLAWWIILLIVLGCLILIGIIAYLIYSCSKAKNTEGNNLSDSQQNNKCGKVEDISYDHEIQEVNQKYY